jgi:hypothetical protein
LKGIGPSVFGEACAHLPCVGKVARAPVSRFAEAEHLINPNAQLSRHDGLFGPNSGQRIAHHCVIDYVDSVGA